MKRLIITLDLESLELTQLGELARRLKLLFGDRPANITVTDVPPPACEHEWHSDGEPLASICCRKCGVEKHA